MLFAWVFWGACPHHAVVAQEPRPGKRQTNPFERFRDLEPAPPPLLASEPAWRLTLPLPPSAGGAMDDARVYVPLRDNGIMAIERETGIAVWFRPIATALAPIVHDGLVFVATDRGIEALDAETGESQWAAPLSGPVRAPMVWDTGWLVAMTEPGDVVALRAADGAVVWQRSIGALSAHAPVAADHASLVFSLADGRVVSLSLVDGEVRWERRLPGTLSAPTAAGDDVFIGSTDNAFYALDARTGEIEWRWRGGGDVIGSSADGDVIYFASLDNVIRAVNRGNGNQRWKKETGTRPLFPPSAFEGLVALPGMSPAMTVFVGKTGAVQGTYLASGNLVGPPLIDRGLKPLGVTFITITREGVVEAMKSTGLIFRELPPVMLMPLPGRGLLRDRLEGTLDETTPNTPTPNSQKDPDLK